MEKPSEKNYNWEDSPKTFGSKIVGGNRSLTIKEVVITVPRPAALESEYDDDGSEDGDKPTDPSGPGKNTGPWY
ncbi:hypothetical protein C7E23_07565 [Elizabethkingia anophelis]|nr:hypothetical protein C7E23_07565 [Elizabethkingia anophelis]